MFSLITVDNRLLYAAVFSFSIAAARHVCTLQTTEDTPLQVLLQTKHNVSSLKMDFCAVLIDSTYRILFLYYGCPPSAIVRFRWLEAASGTVCRLTSPQLQRWLFFGTASKLTFTPDHFLTNCFRFLVLHTVYSSCLAVL